MEGVCLGAADRPRRDVLLALVAAATAAAVVAPILSTVSTVSTVSPDITVTDTHSPAILARRRCTADSARSSNHPNANATPA